MFNSMDCEYESSMALKEHFAKYCDWCWHKGYGNCEVCVKLKNKTLLELKLKEFKSKIILKGKNTRNED